MSTRNDTIDASGSTYGKITVTYPTPNLGDLIVDEQLEIRPENFGATIKLVRVYDRQQP